MGAIFKLDKNSLNKEIEKYVLDKKVSYIEAVLAICEIYNVDPETIPSLLSKPIIEKLHVEGQDLNILKKSRKLPI